MAAHATNCAFDFGAICVEQGDLRGMIDEIARDLLQYFFGYFDCCRSCWVSGRARALGWAGSGPENMSAGRVSPERGLSSVTTDRAACSISIRCRTIRGFRRAVFRSPGVFNPATGALAILPTGTWYMKPRNYLPAAFSGTVDGRGEGFFRQDRRFDRLRQHFPVARGADRALAVGLCPRFAVTALPRAPDNSHISP